uniref:adenylate cyclase n=1 Tax=Heterorhabditis bacteriophora TaxID=37862 RepID=A0A1I7XSA6_HETBA
MLSRNKLLAEDTSYIKLVLHFGVHLLGVHLFILTQVIGIQCFYPTKINIQKNWQNMQYTRNRPVYCCSVPLLPDITRPNPHLAVAINQKCPVYGTMRVADELLKDASELRRPSASLDSNCRTSNATQTLPNEESTMAIPKSVPDVRKFRPFTMNLMTDVSILFADIAGFTKMSSNKSADELVSSILCFFHFSNFHIGMFRINSKWFNLCKPPRFDFLCRTGGLEKISTLGSTPEAHNSFNEKIDQKSPVNGSSSNSMKGSRSSGLQLSLQDGNSELNSVGGLDTAISHHHNAASLTRFDTDNKDFDQRLALVIGQGEGGFEKGFWAHHDSLNKWTLKFIEKVRDENSADRHASQQTPLGRHHAKTDIIIEDIPRREDNDDSSQYRYSGVFIDILVAALILVVVSAILFMSLSPLPFIFLLYFCIALTTVVAAVGLIESYSSGALLIALPVGVALCVVPLCMFEGCPSVALLSSRLLFSYIMILALFAHCNFSQLGAWPKTLQCIFVGLIHVAAVYYCQLNIDNLAEPVEQCVNESRAAFDPSFGSPLFIWEIVLDVGLSIILVGFLNYQFEAAFRMSFFGDVQARRDTERMQVGKIKTIINIQKTFLTQKEVYQIVRDQADWLLNNVIPAHAVESLKTDTKYSENHESTAVLFASITNWNDMYEENFEGGREFLRVLNEVIGDFDELLDRPEFCHIEKIKTIGAAYMAASGLNPERKKNMEHPKEHLYQMVEFALAIQHALSVFNEDLLNFDFVCKLGLNIGPITAGVIGTTKLYYDIWGDTVNIASRMYSTGVLNRIQVSQHTRDLLLDRYDFEYRDHIEVKGVDGGMDTYLLVGRKEEKYHLQ